MRTLEISLMEARRANEVLMDDRCLYDYLTLTSSNTYDLNPDEDGDMDEEQLEYEIMCKLITAGIDEGEFWFYGPINEWS